MIIIPRRTQTWIISCCMLIFLSAHTNTVMSKELTDDNLSTEQIMTLSEIDMEIDDIPINKLDPSTKPAGFDELAIALDKIDKSLNKLESTLKTGKSNRSQGNSSTNSFIENEGNNSFGKANPINLNGQLTGSIQPKRDADWFVLTIVEQGQLSIKSNQVPENIDLVLRAWNANKQSITNWFSPLRIGGELEAVIDFKSPGKYYLEIHDGRDDSKSTESYQLDLQFTASGDKLEPNDSFGKAANIDLEQEFTATILPLRDADWYHFEVKKQGELSITIDQVAENLAIVFRVWNSNKESITNWYSPLSKGGPTEAIIDLPEAGSYYLEVHDDRDDQRSVQPFRLKFVYTETLDSMEPNNSFADAKLLPLDEMIQANILPKRDSDWYRIDTDKQGELNIEITHSPKNLDMVLRVWNSEKSSISNWLTPLAKGGDVNGKVSLPEAGSYYIEVHDGRDDARSISPYSMRVTLN